MPAAAIPLATSAIGGIFSGIGARKPRTSTSTYNSQGTQEGMLDPKQNKIMKAMFQQILAALRLGPTVSQSDRNTARSQINQNFDTGAAGIDANLAARGMGGGGQTGNELNKLQLGRMTAQQSSEATLRDQAVARFMQMLGVGQNFITPRKFETTGSGTQTGSASGTPWQSSVGGGISDLGSYLYLNKLMQGQGGGAGGGGMLPQIGCAIARELYGENSWKVKVLRAWLVRQAEKSWRWRIGFEAYKTFGGSVARLIHTGLFRSSFERSFNSMIIRAMNA